LHPTVRFRNGSDWQADIPSAMQLQCYRALSQPENRQKYDELLVWLASPTIDGAISDEEFGVLAEPGTSIVAEMNAATGGRAKSST